MSAVIGKTKRKYQIALSIELLIFIVAFFILFLWQKNNAISFLLGSFAVFIPHCLFVFIVFFINKKNTHRLMAFYQGGAIKFVCTIILIVVAFKFFTLINYIIFFIGYFLGLLFNNLLPFMVSKFFKI